MSGSFVDHMRPITPAERLGWAAYLGLPYAQWRAARELFRRSFNGDDIEVNLLQFIAATGVVDAGILGALREALLALASEK